MSVRGRLWAALAVAVLLALADLLSGSGGFSLPGGVLLGKLRLPRMLTASLSGAALALAGAQMQAIFRNPLADPHLMGVSGGAGLGAAVVVLCIGTAGSWFSGASIAVAAFVGAFLTALLVVAASSKFASGSGLLIFGVLLGFVFSALGSILQYTAGEENLKLYYSWMAGSFSLCGSGELILLAVALGLGGVVAVWNRKGLDLMLFSEAYAAAAGASPRSIRTLAMVSASILTGAVTAFTGPIGFVGIVAPHLARRICGSAENRKVLPLSLLTGSILTLFADTLASLSPRPLPVGATLSLIGIPMILIFLIREQREPSYPY